MKLLYHPKHQHLDLAVDLGSSWDLSIGLSDESILSMMRSMTNLVLTERQIRFLIDQTDYFCSRVCHQQCIEERETSAFTRNEFIEYLPQKLVEVHIELSNLDLIADALLLLYSLDCVAYFNDENEQVQNDSDEIEVLVGGKWERFKIDTIRQWWVNQELWNRELGIVDCYCDNQMTFKAEDMIPIRKIGYDFVVFICKTDNYPSIENESEANILTLWVNFKRLSWAIKEMTAKECRDLALDILFDDEMLAVEEKDFLRCRLNKIEWHWGNPLQHFTKNHILHKTGQFPTPEELPY